MEDDGTENYHVSSVLHNFVFSSRKRIESGVFHCRYIIKPDLSF